MELGVLDEVRALMRLIEDGTVPESALVVKAHGFRPSRAYLRGELSLEDAAERTKAETRQYARRQRTWLRNQIPADRITLHQS